MEYNSAQTEERFASIDFKGERFSNANLPLDCLENIACYQRILRELAAEIWRERNPERARLPKGFKDYLSLSFSRVRDGSALAEVKRDGSAYHSLPLSYHGIDFLSLAQERFIKVAVAANNDASVSPLPHKLKPDLNKLASNIGDDERLEINSFSSRSGRPSSVRYSVKTRDKLIAAVRVPGLRDISGLAIVTAIDDALEKIKIISEFGVFSFPIGRARLREEFSSALNRTVIFSAQVRVAQSGAITSVTQPRELQLFASTPEMLRLETRLKHLESLQEGWRDGGGRKVATKVMHWARDIGGFLSAKYDGIAAFAQEDGEITFEFSIDNIEAFISVRPDLIRIEAFDDSDADLRSQTFFAVTPKLLGIMSDLKDFVV
jgi:hypothetical protein